MNTTDYFTNINAMFLFCIFICGLLVWAVIRGYVLKGKLLKEQDSHLKATNTNTLLNKALSAKNVLIQATEHKLRESEKEIRELQGKLTESEKQANGYKAEFIAVSNELEATKAKVRKRDANGKFLPSGNGRVRTPKKLKLVTDLGENEVIHCKTAKQRLAIRTLMHEAGLSWGSGRSYIGHDQGTESYGKQLCYWVKKGEYSPLDYYKGLGHTIHPASDFIARPKRVKKVSLKVSADITAVQDAIQGVKDTLTFLGNDTDGTPVYKVEYKADSPKLVHGLTVKNPTEDEAKMIFDEAKRLRIKVSKNDLGVPCPNIWVYHKKICVCIEGVEDYEWVTVVTAKEFVQRMQNGRG